MAIEILIADDHAVVRDGLRFLLEATGEIHVIGEAGDGRTALQMIQELNPEIVLLDIEMPDMNGIDAAEEIRRRNGATKIIMLSMYATREHIFRALRAGARGYLLKEAAAKEVVAAIRAVHAGRRFLSEKIADTVVEDYLDQQEARPEKSPLEQLSPREREILQLVVEGKTSVEIADMLFLSPKSIETYRSRMMQKLGITDIPSLVKFAIQHGLTGLT